MSGLQMRLIAYGISVLLTLGVLGAAWWKVASHYYDQGYAARDREVKTAEDAFAGAVRKGDTHVAAITKQRDQARSDLAQLRAKGREELEHAIEENPQWAGAPALPQRVYDQRVRDLEAIAARARTR